MSEWKENSKILVVGDLMLDRYVIGNVSRVSPEAPVPVLAAAHDENRPGGAANVAANIAAMGGDVTLLALVGTDSISAELEKCIRAYGVTAQLIKDPRGGTTEKTRLVAGAQQIARVDRDVRPTSEMQAKLLQAFERIADDFGLIVLSDYAKGTLDLLPRYLRVAAEKNIPTLVDPKRTDPAIYQGAFLLKPNNNEFAGLFGEASTEEALVTKAHSALNVLGLQHLIVTRGAKGMVVVSADGTTESVPTRAREVFDVSGAGDTVLAALAVSLARGEGISHAVRTANAAAGVAVSHPGTYVVSHKEVSAALAGGELESTKLVGPTDLLAQLAQHRLRNQRIVFTNGCFDLLHPGHVRLLNQARALGDVLVLGLNSDASVRELKGPARPINSYANRAEVVAGLASVDYVIEFDAPTPIDLIRMVQPDVLVKGGDYKISEIVGNELVSARGGQVIALDFHKGHSTTRLASKIAGAASK